jgi:post-segregation antitoxin (ccd killing protein)
VTASTRAREDAGVGLNREPVCAYHAHVTRKSSKVSSDPSTRKRPVNLTLSEDLVCQAKLLTDNLSGVVETLLTDFVSRERQERLEKAKALQATIASWNEFNARFGSIADEYSSL